MLRRKSKFWLVIMSTVALTSLSLLYTYGRQSHSSSAQVQGGEYSVELPPYISALAPFPGSRVPIDEYSKVYWGSNPSELVGGDICVRLDARILDRTLTDPQVAYENYDQFWDSVDLFLNQVPVDSVVYARRISEDEYIFPKTMYRGTDQHSPLPLRMYKPFYREHIPINYCWLLLSRLPAGDYLAHLEIHSELSGTLRYEWTFEVLP
jgi:hypothetical protein